MYLSIEITFHLLKFYLSVLHRKIGGTFKTLWVSVKLKSIRDNQKFGKSLKPSIIIKSSNNI